MSLLRTGDGVTLDVPLEYLEIKDCVFVPTLKIDATRDQIYRLADVLEIKVSTRVSIEDGYMGIMVWRVG